MRQPCGIGDFAEGSERRIRHFNDFTANSGAAKIRSHIGDCDHVRIEKHDLIEVGVSQVLQLTDFVTVPAVAKTLDLMYPASEIAKQVTLVLPNLGRALHMNR